MIKICFNIFRKVLIVAILFLGVKDLFSQQLGTRSHYFIQEYLLNPAFTGSKNYNPFYLSYRQQWSGFKDSPEFFSSSGYYIIDESSNISGSFYNSKQGSEFSQTSGQFNYSHDFHFHQNAHITMGGGVILDQFVADYSDLDIIDPNDPAFSNGINVFSLDAALGVKYFLKRFKLGFSVNNLFETKRNNSVQSSNYNKLPREFRLITQYDFIIDSSLHLEPLLVYKILPESKIQQIDLSLLATYKKAFTLGMSYRSNADLSIIAGIQYKRFYFLYSHELNTSSLASFLGSNNEVTAGYRFKLHPNKIYVDNDMDGIINKKDSCVDLFGTKKHLGCPLEEWAAIVTRFDTLIDSLVINDSLMFTFKKLNSKELNAISLYLVDKEGNVLYKAVKTEDGFMFNYLPYQNEYFFKLDSNLTGIDFEGINIQYFEDGILHNMLSTLNDSIGFFEYKRPVNLANNSIYINDSLMFTFKKLNSKELNAISLYLVDKEGNVLYKAIKTEDGFIFNHLPYQDEYFFKLEPILENLNIEGVNIQYYENGELKNMISRLNNSSGFFEYKRLTPKDDKIPKLLLYNSSKQVLGIAYLQDGVFDFNNIQLPNEYYISPSNDELTIDTVNVVFSTDKAEEVLIYNKLSGTYEFMDFDSSNKEELSALLAIESNDSKTINTKVLDVLSVLEENENLEISVENNDKKSTYFSIQIGAYKNMMNEKVYSLINKKYGNKLQIVFDDRINLQKYIVEKYESFELAKKMNSKLEAAGFNGCFVIGVENNKIVDALYLKDRLK